jgi:hypothetical protein
MKKIYVLFYLITALFGLAKAQDKINSYPVRGFCIAAPDRSGIEAFVKFIETELAPREINTLILRVDFNYQFKTHPELRDADALTEIDVKRLVSTCRKYNISILPQINLLGHQSWAEKTTNLLTVYPQFDETPHVIMPSKYEWPNADGLYCKSYCPLHPDVHKIVFDLVDEVCDAFETNGFHAGMDEVFYIGDDRCPRCSGHDKAELFAGEVTTIRDHLKSKNRRLWIWGDRLIDGKSTGLGMWEASMNNTHRAIDMIPKDVMICDWHYERADKIAVYFAMKGFDVVTCPWRNPSLAVTQSNDMLRFRQESSKEMSAHFQGMVQTVWSDPDTFLNGFYGRAKDAEKDKNTPWHSFRSLFPGENEGAKKQKSRE